MSQPSHTIYGGAHLFRADLAGKLSRTALTWLDRYACPDMPHYARVADRLKAGAVEDLRIDFEDGYGPRGDDEEDEHCRLAAAQVLAAQQEGQLPARWGLRIKPLTPRWAERAQRTLEIFAAAVEGVSCPFRLTLPKTTHQSQIELLLDLVKKQEDRHGLKLELELMVESPDSLPHVREWVGLDPSIRAVHFGPADFLAACRTYGGTLHHPLCQAAKIEMVFALADTGVEWADGPTTLLPVPPHRGTGLPPEQEAENRRVVQQAWSLHQEDVRRSRELGYYQSWLLHPAQLVSLHAQIIQELSQSWRSQALRLQHFLQQSARAVRSGEQFDDRATARLLQLQVEQARQVGLTTLEDLRDLFGQPWNLLNF